MWLLMQWVWLLWYFKDVWKDELFGEKVSPPLAEWVPCPMGYSSKKGHFTLDEADAEAALYVLSFRIQSI